MEPNPTGSARGGGVAAGFFSTGGATDAQDELEDEEDMDTMEVSESDSAGEALM